MVINSAHAGFLKTIDPLTKVDQLHFWESLCSRHIYA